MLEKVIITVAFLGILAGCMASEKPDSEPTGRTSSAINDPRCQNVGICKDHWCDSDGGCKAYCENRSCANCKDSSWTPPNCDDAGTTSTTASDTISNGTSGSSGTSGAITIIPYDTNP
jgi:hypothetical protein